MGEEEEEEEEEKDDDEEKEEGEIDEEEKDDDDKNNNKNKKKSSKRDKFTKKRNRDNDDDDQNLDNLFSFIINGHQGRRNESIFNRNPNINRELNSKRDNKKAKKEGFYDYFKEAKELTPINKKI